MYPKQICKPFLGPTLHNKIQPCDYLHGAYVEHIPACCAHSLICSHLRETKLYRKCWGPLDNTSASAVIHRHITNNVSICNPEHIEARGRNDEASETLALINEDQKMINLMCEWIRNRCLLNGKLAGDPVKKYAVTNLGSRWPRGHPSVRCD